MRESFGCSNCVHNSPVQAVPFWQHLKNLMKGCAIHVQAFLVLVLPCPGAVGKASITVHEVGRCGGPVRPRGNVPGCHPCLTALLPLYSCVHMLLMLLICHGLGCMQAGIQTTRIRQMDWERRRPGEPVACTSAYLSDTLLCIRGSTKRITMCIIMAWSSPFTNLSASSPYAAVYRLGFLQTAKGIKNTWISSLKNTCASSACLVVSRLGCMQTWLFALGSLAKAEAEAEDNRHVATWLILEWHAVWARVAVVLLSASASLRL